MLSEKRSGRSIVGTVDPTPNADALLRQQRADELSSRLPPLLVAAERVAATVAQGVHGRRRVGMGESFWQFRRYQAGDAATAIDWRQSAKSDPVFVRENEWEAAQSVWLWRDASPSMAYRSSTELATKRDRADLLTLALAVLLVRGGERVALIGGGQMPRSGRTMLGRLAIELGADVPEASELPTPAGLPRHAQVVIMGDLLSPLSGINETVSDFSARGITGHLLQILDPSEETLPFDGRIEFRGLEGEPEEVVPRVETIRDAYVERLKAHQAGLSTLARAAGWTFAIHRTDRPPQTALLALYGALAREAVA